jgi:predicted nucleic acid-binding protein
LGDESVYCRQRPQGPQLTVERILTREELRQARQVAEEKLAETKELEKQWQTKQAEMDQALKVLFREDSDNPAILTAGVVFQARDIGYRVGTPF